VISLCEKFNHLSKLCTYIVRMGTWQILGGKKNHWQTLEYLEELGWFCMNRGRED